MLFKQQGRISIPFVKQGKLYLIGIRILFLVLLPVGKKKLIFQRLSAMYRNNPAMFWAMGWVSIVPSLGSLLTLNLLYSRQELLDQVPIFDPWTMVGYVAASALLMGAALLPTTFLAVLSGFAFGWAYFPLLVTGYTLASLMGYSLGRKLDKNSLDQLLDTYPKAAQLIAEKKGNLSQLIFYVRLSPVIPFALSNLLFALLKAGIVKVVWMGLWGMLPRSLLAFATGVVGESLVETMQERDDGLQFAVLVLLLLVSGWGIYRFFTKR